MSGCCRAGENPDDRVLLIEVDASFWEWLAEDQPAELGVDACIAEVHRGRAR